MEEKSPQVCCPLCGGECRYDGRDAWHACGAAIAWFGLFLLPLGSLLLLSWVVPHVDDITSIAIGVAVWAGLVIACFTRPALWVCWQCGAYYPARRLPS